jgi:nitrite reductase/ring-hydroxylating ferredoxin subunit
MFVHENQLRHVLPPQAYFSEDQHRRELERALLPGWHLVASMGDLRRDGDYVTLTLFDRPLLVRRTDGEAHVYLNVCGHRHCLLTSRPRGHDPAFRCQYHGWEYQCDGRTGKIPEAGSFRPFDRENARLVKFRSARCGDLVFANLSDSGPSLQEQMAETFEPVARAFSEPFRQVWQWDPEYPTNARALGLPFKGHYTQYHVYPNLVVILMDVVSLVKLVVPTSPTTSRAIVRVFTPYGPRRRGRYSRRMPPSSGTPRRGWKRASALASSVGARSACGRSRTGCCASAAGRWAG